MKITNILITKLMSGAFKRFLITGIGFYIFISSFTYLFTEIFKINFIIFYITALTITTIINFKLSTNFIFNVRDNQKSRFAKFTILMPCFYLLNIILVKLMTDLLFIHYIIAITITTGVMFIIKFIVYEVFVFNKKIN